MTTTAKDPQRPAHNPANSTIAGQSEAVARKARDQALAAGLTVTVYKEGQLIQERLVGGKIKTLIKQRHDDNNV